MNAKESKNSITIKDISKQLNISSVSVHRALAGKEGVSDELRKKILQTATEMGYETNYAAASLKRKTSSVAVILPQDDGYYYSFIWAGIKASAADLRGLNINVEYFVCMDEDQQADLLKMIADQSNKYSGVITFSYTRRAKVLMQLQRLIALNVMTIVIDDDLSDPEGLYCVRPNEVVLAQLASEFISLVTPDKGTVLITRGNPDSVLHTNKVKAFSEFLQGSKPQLHVEVVEGYFQDASNTEEVEDSIVSALKKNQDTVACYALTSHDNLPMVQAVAKTGKSSSVKIIGTDLNSQTAQFLRQGKLLAILNQAAFMKGYMSLSRFAEKVIKNREVPQYIDCPLDIILKSNLSFFESSNHNSIWRYKE